jgi:hypothetical protein
MHLNGIKTAKKGEGRYKTMNGNFVLQLPEQKNRRRSSQGVSPKTGIREFGCKKN